MCSNCYHHIGKSNPKLRSRTTTTTITTHDPQLIRVNRKNQNYNRRPSKDPFLVHKITPPPFFTGHIRPNERTPLASHPTERSSWLKHIHSIPFLSITWINRDHPKEVAISPSLPLSPVSCRRLLQAGARDRCLKRRTSRITFILSAPPDALRDHKAEGQGDEQQRSKKRNIS